MYKPFFNLKQTPFSASPDPSFLSMLPHTREALAGLEYGISFRKGIIVLTGEVGTGKTTILRSAMEKFQAKKVHFSYVFNPRFDVLDFLEFVLTDFGVPIPARTKSSMLLQFSRWLIDRFREGETCVIIVDEAQDCSWDLLEEIRLLTNLETSTEKLVQVILSGQPELEAHLRKENARQLRQRVAIWCRTFPLSLEETERYMQERLQTAGATRRIFSEDATQTVHTLSHGIPRSINLICEHSLVLAYVNQEAVITPSIIEAVSRDLVLDQENTENSADLHASPVTAANDGANRPMISATRAESISGQHS
jgi:general secretion pathway protein A